MIGSNLFGEFVVYVFFGLVTGIVILLVGELIRLVWFWLDDYESKIDNIISAVVFRLCGYHRQPNGRYVEIKDDTTTLIDPIDAWIIFTVFCILLSIGYYLYLYFPMFGIVFAIIVGVLFLAKYVRRLHKKIDKHITNHK